MFVLIDCCLTQEWVDYLSIAGHKAVHWKSIGVPNDVDQRLANWAASNDAVLLTQDLDFGAILATQGRTKPSVVQIRAESNLPEEVGSLVASALSTYESELVSGAIVTVDYGRVRIRSLPLTKQ